MTAISTKTTTWFQTTKRVLKIIAIWAAIAVGAYLLFPIVSEYLSRPQVLAAIVVANVIATIALWRETARKPPRPKNEFLHKLTRSEPITPKHHPPRLAGGDLSSLAADEDRVFFADFAELAHVVNWWLADEKVGSRWRLQELPDGDVRLNVDFSDGPIMGRCYDLFHNQVRVGRLEIRPDYEYTSSTPKVITEVELDNARLLSFHSIAGFFRDVAMHVCEQSGDERVDVNQAIVNAVIEALWHNQQITEFSDLDDQDWGELSVHLRGYASDWYFRRREALRKRRR